MLTDGEYELRLDADKILDPGAIDRVLQDTDGLGDGRYTFVFHRLFGDTDGDGDVDNLDFFRLRSTFRKRAGDDGFLAYLDYNGDGIIDALDLAEVAKRRRIRFGG